MADLLAKRSGLKVLQQSLSQNSINLGNGQASETTQKKRKISTSSSQKKRKTLSSFSVFEDCVPSEKTARCVQCEDKAVNTVETHIEITPRISASDLTSDEPGIDYWKELAETRRQALEKTLEENEQLHKKVSDLTCELVELKEEAEKYEELAEHAEQLAETVKMLTGLSDGCDEQTQEEADKASDDNLDSVAPTSEVKQQLTSDVTQGPSSASTSEHVSLA